MNRKNIARELLLLSRRHLQLAEEENWNAWEVVAGQKEELYRELQQLKDPSLDTYEKAVLFEISALEEQLKEKLNKKRDEARQALVKINRFKSGLQSYRQVKKKGSGRHFCIKG